eukprot:scaffold226167_cov25-Tisochrysis_lutea.AAC.2
MSALTPSKTYNQNNSPWRDLTQELTPSPSPSAEVLKLAIRLKVTGNVHRRGTGNRALPPCLRSLLLWLAGRRGWRGH